MTNKPTMTDEYWTITHNIHKAYLHGDYELEDAIEVAFEAGIRKGKADAEKVEKTILQIEEKELEEIKRKEYNRGYSENVDKYYQAGKRWEHEDFKKRLTSNETIAMVNWLGLHQYEVRNFINQLIAISEADGK